MLWPKQEELIKSMPRDSVRIYHGHQKPKGLHSHKETSLNKPTMSITNQIDPLESGEEKLSEPMDFLQKLRTGFLVT